MKDLVRVDEVQGALRKLTESFKLSIQQIDELGAARLREMEERLGQKVDRQYLEVVTKRYESVIERLMKPQDDLCRDVKYLLEAINMIESELKTLKAR